MLSMRRLFSFCWICIEGVLLCAVLLALVAGAAAWRLSRGPVSLAFLQEDLEQALSQALNSDAVSLGAASAAWSVRDRAFVVVLTDVEASDEGGEALAIAPRVEAGLRVTPLLQGRLAFKRLAAEGGELSIVRAPSGRVVAGLGSPEEVLASAPAEEAVSGAGGLEVFRRLTASLQEVRLLDVTLHLYDPDIGIDWRADSAELVVERERDASVRATARGDIAGPEGSGSIRVELVRSAEAGASELEFELIDSPPAAFAPETGSLAFLSEFHAPVTLAASVDLDKRGHIGGADVSVEIGQGPVSLCAENETLTSGRLQFAYVAETDSLLIEEGVLEGDASSGRVSGRVDGLNALLVGDGDQPVIFQAILDDFVCGLQPTFAVPLVVARADIAGRVDPAEHSLSFDKLDVDVRDLNARLRGTFTFQETDNGRWLPSVRLKGPIAGEASHQDLLDLWPTNFALGARDWLEQSVSAGRLSNLSVEIDMEAEDLASQRLDAGVLRIPFSFEDATVRFVSSMSPLTRAAGVAAIDGNSFELTMRTAQMAGLELEDGFVEIPRLAPKGALARFGATANGDAQDIIAFIDEPPLNFASDFGLSPEDFEGVGSVKVELRRPMRREVPVSDLGFEVDGVFENVRARTPVPGVEVEGATVQITATPEGVSAVGVGQLGPAPAEVTWVENFDGEEGASTQMTVRTRMDARVLDVFGIPSRGFMEGETDLQIDTRGVGMSIKRAEVVADLTSAALTAPGSKWRKDAGEPGTARFALMREDDGSYEIDDLVVETQDVHFAGGLRVGPDGRLEALELNPLTLGSNTDLSGELRREDDGTLHLELAGYAFDARALIAELPTRGMAQIEGEKTPVRLSARFGTVTVADDVRLQNVALHLNSDGERVSFLSFDADGPRGHMSATLAPEGPGLAGPRLVTASAPDAGLVMRSLFGINTLEGGALTVNGILPSMDARAGAPGRMDVAVDAFHLRGAPTLAQILTLGSFRGLADTLNGEGIAFDRLEAPVTLSGGRFTLDEARAAGPALGVTVSGDIDPALKELSLSGVLAPAYSLNSLIGDVPLVGGLLVSREGEGVFGLTYSVQGPFEETRVFVNPLSALAPGRLRRLFEGSSALEDPPPTPEPLVSEP